MFEKKVFAETHGNVLLSVTQVFYGCADLAACVKGGQQGRKDTIGSQLLMHGAISHEAPWVPDP